MDFASNVKCFTR